MPANPVTVVTGSFSVLGFAVTSQAVYVFDGTDIRLFSLSGSAEGSFPLPQAFTGQNVSGETGPYVDPSGDIWMDSRYGHKLAKFSPSGSLLWSTSAYPNSTAFGISGTTGYELGIHEIGSSTTELVDDTGAHVATLHMALSGYVSQAPNGDLLVSNAGYVTTYNMSGHLLARFGSSQSTSSPTYTGDPYHFSDPGQALRPLWNGPTYTVDPLGTIEETSPQGYLQATTNLGGHLQVSNNGAAYLVNGILYFVGGTPFSSNENISSVPLATVQQYLASPSPALDVLGWGAGITSGSPTARVLGNYFPYGTTPSFYASFDPWWRAQASHLQLSYSVWTDSDVREGAYPEPTTLALSTSRKALSDIPLTIPPADGRPGPYELQAELWDTAASPPELLGATCAPYSVGAPGDALNVSSLPTGEGYGGPADPRGVVLNSELGLDGFRGAAIAWGAFLPGCNPSAPTATSCDAAAMTFADAPQSYFQAAYLAGQDKVSYWVQVSTGDPVSKALVANGWWEQDVQAIVAYYSGTSHCTLAGGQCAPVTAWEPWNEANNTYSSDGSSFVKEILEPFYHAVKAAAPQDVVIGGSSLGVALAWWQQVVAAGGLAYMDFVGVHPYTGNNDSWDEDGTVAQLVQLQRALGAKPVWLTEVGWWSDGPYNFLGQASTVATALIWQKALAIPVWSYFFDEGGWGNDGVSFSLVQAASTDDYVKPAALAAMEASQQLAGRAYLGSPKTGVALTYDAYFGPAPGASDNLAAVWTDGLSVTAQVAVSSAGSGPVTLTVTDQWGNTGSYQLAPGQYYALPFSSEVTYLSFPQDATLSVVPTEHYGADLALASRGAVAVASSSASGYRAEDATNGVLTGGWEPAHNDLSPAITVHLEHQTVIDRALVDGHSLGSLIGDPRDFTVSVERPDGSWLQVASVTGTFYDHATLVTFPAVSAQALRVVVEDANYGGYAGGGVPSWWPASLPLTLEIHAVQVYAAASAAVPKALMASP